MFFFDYFFSPVKYCLNPFITTSATDHISILPAEVLREVMKNLSVTNVKSLQLTCKKIEPIAEMAIKAKPQENLEYILVKILNGDPYNYTKCQPFFDKINSLPDKSEERVQVLRDAICFMLKKVDFWFVKRKMETLPFFEDKLLPKQMLLTANPTLGLCSPALVSNPNHATRLKADYKLMILFLKMLRDNEISSLHFFLSFNKDYKIINRMMQLIVRVFNKNQSIHYVKIAFCSIGTVNLIPLFKAIIENPRIEHVCVQEGDRSNLPLAKWKTIDDTLFISDLHEILTNRPNETFNCWRWDRR